MTNRAFIGIGSNIDPEDNIRKAIRLLALETRITAISTTYRTAAENQPDQAHYLNCVVEIRTEMPPLQLKHRLLRKIEETLGRKRGGDKNAPRTIDLDLILYDDLVLDTEELTIPDPLIMHRPFLAHPLCELAPGMKIPGSGLTICKAAELLSLSGMHPLQDFTDLLRKEGIMNKDKIENLIRELLSAIGEDPDREGLLRTPTRIAASLAFLTSGYHEEPQKLINEACFAQETDSMVIVKDIELYSLCEHHMLPFFGRCHIGYIPRGRVFGVSKLARLVDMYARRLQIQERLTEQIAHTVMNSINASGVGVMIEARHLCMMMRGVQKQNSMLVTSSLLGTFRDSHATRHEFLSLVRKPASELS